MLIVASSILGSSISTLTTFNSIYQATDKQFGYQSCCHDDLHNNSNHTQPSVCNNKQSSYYGGGAPTVHYSNNQSECSNHSSSSYHSEVLTNSTRFFWHVTTATRSSQPVIIHHIWSRDTPIRRCNSSTTHSVHTDNIRATNCSANKLSNAINATHNIIRTHTKPADQPHPLKLCTAVTSLQQK